MELLMNNEPSDHPAPVWNLNPPTARKARVRRWAIPAAKLEESTRILRGACSAPHASTEHESDAPITLLFTPRDDQKSFEYLHEVNPINATFTERPRL